MPNGTRQTAGVNTTAMQEKHRGRGLENKIKSKTPLQLAAEWLIAYLEENGPTQPAVVRAAAEEAGISENVLNDAKKDLGIQTMRDGPDWTWGKPPSEEGEESEATAVAIDRSVPGEDEFTLTPEELKTFGIKENEDYCWIRDPKVWEDTRVAPGRVRQFHRDNPGARLIMHKGDYVTCGSDLILAVRPRAEIEAAQKRDRRREQEYWGQIEREKMEDDEFDPKNRDAVEERKHRNSMENIRNGYIGPASPSSGLPYEDYIKYRGLTKEEIEDEAMTHCLGHNYRDLDGEDAENAMRQHREQRQQQGTDRRRDGGGKFISIPQNVRPRNLMNPSAAKGAGR